MDMGVYCGPYQRPYIGSMSMSFGFTWNIDGRACESDLGRLGLPVVLGFGRLPEVAGKVRQKLKRHAKASGGKVLAGVIFIRKLPSKSQAQLSCRLRKGSR